MKTRLIIVGVDLGIIFLTIIAMAILLVIWPFYLMSAIFLDWKKFNGIQERFHNSVTMKRK